MNDEDPRQKKQIKQFDSIAYNIEKSSSNNKKILAEKYQEIINHIPSSTTDSKSKHDYAEWNNYVSIFSEIKIFDELSKLSLQKIQFLEKKPNIKTPDFKASDGIHDIFIEVKFIGPPKDEEIRMTDKNSDCVKRNPNWWEKVRKKLVDHLKNAKAKFEAMDAYTNSHKRWVYVYIMWGIDAKIKPKELKETENVIKKELVSDLENKFKINLKFFKTFNEQEIH